MSKDTKWYAYYRGAWKSSRAAEVQEPYQVDTSNWRYDISTNLYDTMEEAQGAFNKAVVNHAKDVIWSIKTMASNKSLNKRLINAGRDDVANMFNRLEKLAESFHKDLLNG